MRYELYIDVLFLTNFMMDSLLLLSVKKVMGFKAAYGRLFFSAALASALTCAVISVPAPRALKLLIFHVVINLGMLLLGLHIKQPAQLFKAVGCLYVTSFLLGGILQALRPYVRTGSLFFTAAVAAYYLLCVCWRFLSNMKKIQRQICEVTLFTELGPHKVRALLDTGNVLTDPLSKLPVSVIDRSLARKIFDRGPMAFGEGQECFMEAVHMEGIRYIPYKSIGGEGWMPVLRIPEMCVHLKEERWIKEPVIGICKEKLSRQEEYQIILNPDILGGITDGCKSSSTAAV